jgi:hypothetical protein
MTEASAGQGTAVESPGHPVPKLTPLIEHDIADALAATLPERGLDRMTPDRIESTLCTSALTAHL